MALSATLASSSGTSTIVLNPLAKSTTVMLTLSTTGSSGAVQVDMSLDDPTIPGGPTATWGLLSSGAAMLSSNLAAGGLIYTVLSPVGMVRINSTANNTSNTFTLKALQSVTA
jgi:hypothetical protein